MLRVMLTQPVGQTHPLERCIVSPFRDFFISKSSKDMIRDLFPTRKVNHLDRTVVLGISKQQDFKVGGFCITVHTAFLQIDIRECLKVDR